MHRDGRPPNRLVVHRKGITGDNQGDNQRALAYELHCRSNYAQVAPMSIK